MQIFRPCWLMRGRCRWVYYLTCGEGVVAPRPSAAELKLLGDNTAALVLTSQRNGLTRGTTELVQHFRL
jgi:hypothetical protein